MIKLWTERAASFLEFFFSGRIMSYKGVVRQTQIRYGEPAEIKFYSKSSIWSFLPEEEKVLTQIREKSGKVLVVGCGAGREFSRLAGLPLFGVDDCTPLLSKCQENFPGAVLEKTLSAFSEERFDSIFVSFHVYNHIQGRQHRITFLKSLARMCSERGEIFLFVDVFKLEDGPRYLAASWLLRFLWIFSGIDWEAGDTLRKYNGDHNPWGRLFFYHYFREIDEIMSELGSTGLQIQAEKNCWKLTSSIRS
jgi:SAM-dependent methyltransferase